MKQKRATHQILSISTKSVFLLGKELKFMVWKRIVGSNKANNLFFLILGSPVGNIIAIPVTGLLSKYGFDGGWPSVFYFFGESTVTT